MKSNRNRILAVVAAASLLACLAPGASSAQQGTNLAKYQYTAKFVCGQNPQSVVRVVPGWYATAVNIHNPSDKPVAFRKKIALTFPPPEQRPGDVSDFIVDKLGPDEALAVDCEEIPSEFFPNSPPPSPYVKGFLVIESFQSLDVTAVYTAGGAADPATGLPAVHSIDVEQIRERRN